MNWKKEFDMTIKSEQRSLIGVLRKEEKVGTCTFFTEKRDHNSFFIQWLIFDVLTSTPFI